MIQWQAEFLAEQVQRIMDTEATEQFKSAKFNIIAHSMGSYTTYKAMQSNSFPADRLNNVILLAAPLNTPPQFLTSSLDSALKDIVAGFDHNRYKNTAHFNFDGGLRDFHVTTSTTPFSRIMAGSKK